MRRVTIVLNNVQADLVDQLVQLGIYGRDVEDVILRALDRQLLRVTRPLKLCEPGSYRPQTLEMPRLDRRRR